MNPETQDKQHRDQEEGLQHAAEHERPNKRNSVLFYLVILFAAAFVLLLMSFLMQQRANQAALDDLQQTSDSTVQSLENMLQENESLKEQNAELQAQVDALEKERHLYPGWVFLLGYAAASGFFAAFFGGDLLDSLYAGVCGLAVGVWMLYVGGRLGFNGFIQTLFGAAIASLVALALVNLTPQQNLDAITIGTLMVLVPGRALTNAMWEIMAGDIISGVNRTAEALLTAAAIALGVVVALAVGQ